MPAVTIDPAVDSDFDWLQRCRKGRYSQYGEDAIAMAIFGVVEPANHWAFECGAGDGVQLSNTLALVERGWRAIMVEARQITFDAMVRRHNCRGGIVAGLDRRIIRVHGRIEPTGEWSPSSIIARYGAPRDIDLFSLDIDGGEADVLQAMNCGEFNQLRPRVMVVERYHVRQTLTDVVDAATPMGYVPVHINKANVILAAEDVADQLRRNEE